MTASLEDPPAASLEHRLGALLAGEPAALEAPAGVYREVREAARAFELGPVVLVTAYEDVREGLRDATRLSNRALVEGSRHDAARARLQGDARDAFDEVIAFEANFPSRNDGRDHGRLRGLANRAFTARRIAELEDATRGYVDEVLTEIADTDTADGMVLAYRIPLMVVADLLGVPASDRELIHGWSVKLGAANASTEAGPMLEARDALHEFRAYVGAMLAEHRRRPRATDPPVATDLISMLIGAEQDERVSEEELAALFVQLLFAGHETTATLIGVGLLELLRAPDQWRALVADPGRIPNAVEELLRHVSPAQFVSRLALTQIDLGAIVIAPDTTVLLVIAAANRDPAVFEHPDALDIRRTEARQNLGFGLGPHFCLGAALARLEARVTLSTLVERHPALELADAPLQWSGSAMLRHLARLPLALGPAG